MEKNNSGKSHRWTVDWALPSHIPPEWATATFTPWEAPSPCPILQHLARALGLWVRGPTRGSRASQTLTGLWQKHVHSYSAGRRGLLGMHISFWAEIKATWGHWQPYFCCCGCDPTMSFFTSLNARMCKQQWLEECILAWALPFNPIWDNVSLHWRQAQSNPGLLKALVCSFTPGMLLLGAVHFLLQDLKAPFFFSFFKHISLSFHHPLLYVETKTIIVPISELGKLRHEGLSLKQPF